MTSFENCAVGENLANDPRMGCRGIHWIVYDPEAGTRGGA